MRNNHPLIWIVFFVPALLTLLIGTLILWSRGERWFNENDRYDC